MGFGILLFGYFLTFAFSLSNYYFFADIIGAVVMLYSFTKLSEYNTYYKTAFWICSGFLVTCGVSAASLMLHLYEQGGTLAISVNIVKLALGFALHIIVFLGARGISLGAEAGKLVRNSERQMVMTSIYYISAFAVLVLNPLLRETERYISFVVLVYWFVTFIMNLAFIYKCFGILCPAEEDDNEEKRSRFGIINKMNDTIESIEKNTKKYGEDSIRLAIRETAKLDSGEVQHKKHKKKKH